VLFGTLLVTPVALTSLGWVGYAQEQAGEIQGAQSLRNQLFINLGGGLVSTVMMAVLAFAMVLTVGQNWLSAAAGAGAAAPIAPWFSNLAIMLTDNPIILFLMIIGILLNALQVVFNVIIGWTRVAVAMSIDGVFPKIVSSVSPRTHTPVFAHVLFLLLGGYLYAYIFNMVPDYAQYTLAVTAVATVMYIGTAIGGAVFPRTRREVYRTSPIAKYKVGPIPLITICGVIAAAFSGWMLYYYITQPFLGIADLSKGFDGVKSLLIMFGIFVGWTIYYFIRRAYLKGIGINLDHAYKEIPPI
jgi:amino acid transporter